MLPAETVDLVVTSPPYDKLRTYNGYRFDFEPTAQELARVLKPGGVIVWVVGDATVDGSETGTSFRQALYFKDHCGLNLHDTMIYEKSGFTFPHARRYHQIFEYMFILSKGAPKTFNGICDRVNKTAGNKISGTSRQRDGSLKLKSAVGQGKFTQPLGRRWNIWRYATGWMKSSPDRIAFDHPAIFPEQLAADHILTWSNEDELVVDPFLGSGTTAKMALLHRRRFLGIDTSAEYLGIAQERTAPLLTAGE